MIIRTAQQANYTALPNAIARDRHLALDTKGLLVYLLSLPPKWEIRPQQIAKALSPEGGRPIGRERLQRMFRELEEAGYMVRSREQTRRDGGYWGGFDYIVGDDPETVSREADGQSVAFLPQPGLPSTAQPSTANPATDVIKKDTKSRKRETESLCRSETQYGDAAIDEAQQGLAIKELKKPSAPKRITGNGDRGAIELAIAQRLGPNGFEVLMALPPSRVDALCAQQRRGALDDGTLDRLRSSLPLFERRGA